MNNTFLFVDGSSLLSDLVRIRKKHSELASKKLVLKSFLNHFVHGPYGMFIGDGFKRFTVYFVNGEDRINDSLVLPQYTTPNELEDFHIRYCGKRLKGAKQLQNWLDKSNPPNYVIDRLNKSEKAVDTQICCDALQLAANNRIDRLFIYTNDFDFMPLCDTLKSMGANVSLFRLITERTNKDLLRNTDSFHVPKFEDLEKMFE